MAEARYASFNPDEATVQGLFDEGDFEIVDPRIDYFQYANSNDRGVGLLVTLKDKDGREYEKQFWSAGGDDKVVPSSDNTKFMFSGTSNALNVKSNFVKFMASLKNAGVPVSLFEKATKEGIGAFAGLQVHLQRVPNPDAQKNAKGEQPKTIVATKLIALPGEKKAASGGAKSTAKATTAAAPAATEAAGSDDEKLIGYIVQAIDANDGGKPVAHKAIAQKVFQVANAAGDAQKLVLSKRAYDETFLKANSGSPVQVGEELVAFEYDAEAKVIKKAA